MAGDFDGNGTDDVAVFFNGTWEIHYLGAGAPPDAGSFVYTAATAAPYPVVGDWDADGTDTVGVRSGATWLPKNTNTAGATPDIAAFDFGGANDLPVVWAQ